VGELTELRNREDALMALDFVPAWEFWVLVPVAAIYFTCRAFILVDVFANLRAQAAKIYRDIHWLTLVPHMK
jgi:hypothetical protein